MKGQRRVTIGDIDIGRGRPLVLIAGPCVIESERSALDHARRIRDIAKKHKMPFIFKSSYDKANRSSLSSFRGPGLEKGLEILDKVRRKTGVPVLSDVHSEGEIGLAGEVLDVIQIPAFLCRQTDLLLKAAATGKPVNIKKGQFMSPQEMVNAVAKVESKGNRNILLTERGTMFGYNQLVNDFRAISIMGGTGYPVVYDATHSVQRPGGLGKSSGGAPEYIIPLSRAAVAYGTDALFLEVHQQPRKAMSDGPNMLRMDQLGDLLRQIKKVERAVRGTS